jgi:hypothetical protein
MNLDELKIRLAEVFSQRWSEFQESSAYLQLKDKYEDLSTSGQQVTKLLGGLFLIVVVGFLPYTWLDSASTYLADFELKRDLTRDLLQLRRDQQQAPQLPFTPAASDLKTQADGVLQSLQLLPEQIKSSQISTFRSEQGSEIPSAVSQAGVVITLEKLNLKQLVELSYRLQTLSDLVKLTAFDVKASIPDPHYFDAMLRLVSFQATASNSAPGSNPSRGK